MSTAEKQRFAEWMFTWNGVKPHEKPHFWLTADELYECWTAALSIPSETNASVKAEGQSANEAAAEATHRAGIFDKQETFSRQLDWDKAPTPRTDAEVINATFPDADVVAAGFCRMLERELAEEKALVERMMDAEQERLLLASEDEIRKEILADGRDPAEYLKAVDKVMKLTGENALLKHDLQKALANHSADLSARDAVLEEAASAVEWLKGEPNRFECAVAIRNLKNGAQAQS